MSNREIYVTPAVSRAAVWNGKCLSWCILKELSEQASISSQTLLAGFSSLLERTDPYSINL